MDPGFGSRMDNDRNTVDGFQRAILQVQKDLEIAVENEALRIASALHIVVPRSGQ